jgi:hypothetical protein
MTREKRTRRASSYVADSLYEQLDLFRVQERGNVTSMSDYLHEVIEEHVAIRIAKQKLGRRVGNQ